MNEPIKTLDMELAIFREFSKSGNIVVNNFCHTIVGLHECDMLILNPRGYATEIELKISTSDLRADFKKFHGHINSHIARFFYAVPKKLVKLALELIPERAGLYSISNKTIMPAIKNYYGYHPEWVWYKIEIIRKAKRTKNAHRWTDEERLKLAVSGSWRIFPLKKKIEKLMRGEL